MKELTMEEMMETIGGYRDDMVDKHISDGAGGGGGNSNTQGTE